MYSEIKELAKNYADRLQQQVNKRVQEMITDDQSHQLIYRVLGISSKEGEQIDVYQNKGRFLYKYAGSFLEEATILCLRSKYSSAKPKVKINNTLGSKPKKFEIDCLIDNFAYEIKWRDATTDGDHITKEHTRIKTIVEHGYIPVRLMFYYPNRAQAQKIQDTLRTLYAGVGGNYYSGEEAWSYLYLKTGIDLKLILEEIANNMDV